MTERISYSTAPARRLLSETPRSWWFVFAGFTFSACAVSFNDWPQGNNVGGATGGRASAQGGSNSARSSLSDGDQKRFRSVARRRDLFALNLANHQHEL
jgi:hypothetical protein